MSAGSVQSGAGRDGGAGTGIAGIVESVRVAACAVGDCGNGLGTMAWSYGSPGYAGASSERRVEIISKRRGMDP
jgi:hypothetical protein